MEEQEKKTLTHEEFQEFGSVGGTRTLDKHGVEHFQEASRKAHEQKRKNRLSDKLVMAELIELLNLKLQNKECRHTYEQTYGVLMQDIHVQQSQITRIIKRATMKNAFCDCQIAADSVDRLYP